MPRALFVITLALFLVSCGLIPQDDTAPAIQRERSSQAQPTPTATFIPTPTIDYIATVHVAQATADAANRLMVQATADQDQRQHEQLSWTAVVDQATITAAALTAQSDSATATAAPTYVGPTMTAQVENMQIARLEAENASTAIAATLEAPTHIVAVAQAEAIADFADDIQRAEVGIRIAIGFFLFSFAVFILIASLLRVKSGISSREENEEEHEFMKSNLVHVQDAGKDGGELWILNYNTIPCTIEQLVELADGVINRGMSMSFNIWEGTTVHRSLQKIRDYFQERKLAKLVHNSNGMLDLTAEGESLLRYVSENGTTPPPFSCLPESA